MRSWAAARVAISRIPNRGNAQPDRIFRWSGDARRSIDQVRVTGPEGAVAGPHCPLTLEVTLGGLPGPCDTTSVDRVQVAPPLLTETTVVLVWPAGSLL